LQKDLAKKMVFLSGPRQTGKTTLAKSFLQKNPGLYLNWDDVDDRRKILARDWIDEERLLVIDELHKYSRWKNFLKGTYDTQNHIHQFLVTGSARLDTFKKGQDSMMGRFYSWRLHPLCLSELKNDFAIKSTESALERLLRVGGFPEPFFAKNDIAVKRWRKERTQAVFRQDIRELENIRDLSLLEIFHDTLTERVSSGIVVSNIARDLEIAPKTGKNWLELLERSFALFLIRPYSKGLSKAILKTPKVYFYDNGEVRGDDGARFENLVACHLLKRIQFLEDSKGDRYRLCYLEDKQKHSVDFGIVKNNRLVCLLEVKLSDETISPSLVYFRERLGVETCIQLVYSAKRSYRKNGVWVASAAEWLSRPLEEEFW
jgi:hypothetical protein